MATIQSVIAGFAYEDVLAVTAVDLIVPRSGAQQVITRTRVDDVVTRPGENHIIPSGAHQGVGPWVPSMVGVAAAQ